MTSTFDWTYDPNNPTGLLNTSQIQNAPTQGTGTGQTVNGVPTGEPVASGAPQKTPAAPTPSGTNDPGFQWTYDPNNPTGLLNPTAANAAANQSATATIDAWAQSVGLGSLSGWINQQYQTLAGQGMDATDIANTIETTINTAPGFDALLPGYNLRITNGYTNTDPNTGAGIAGYMAYVQQVQAMAETAGLVPGTITLADIGQSWANDVSTNELSDRITTEYTNAINAQPAIQAELVNYGYTNSLSPGQLASYYLNPDNTVSTLQQQFNSAVAGGEGTLTGFGEIGKSQAYALQAFLSNGGQNNLSTGQAANFFSGQLGNGLNSIAAMANAGFEQAQLGTAQNGPGTVTQSQLLGAAEGNAAALAATQRAAQTRAAPGLGGGGFTADQSGVAGVGYGNS
jgi:hypothetical protein